MRAAAATTKQETGHIMAAANDAGAAFGKAGANVGAGFGKIVTGGNTVGGAMRGMAGAATNAGSALSALGPIGMAAGVGILSLGAAFTAAMESMAFADDIADTAAQLGITTDKLQEFDYIALKTGADTDAFREAITKGNAALGAFQSGIGAGKVTKVFDALGITKEEASKWNDITDGLDLISDKIRKLGSSAEQVKVAKSLGLEAMLPAIRASTQGFAAMAKEAHDLGFVMDSEIIARAGEMQDKMDVASQTIKVQLNEAFVSLLPSIAKVLEAVTGVANVIANIQRGWTDVESQTSDQLVKTIAQQRAIQEDAIRTAKREDPNARIARDGLGRARMYSSSTVANGNYARAWDEGEKARVAMSLKKMGTSTAPKAAAITSTPVTASGGSSKSSKSGPTAKELADMRAALNLENELTIARITGDKVRIQALEDQKDLTDLIERFQRAGVADAQAQAETILSGIQLARRIAEAQDLKAIAAPKVANDFVSAEDRQKAVLEPITDAQDAIRDTFRNAMSDGLNAAIYGGWDGLSDYMADSFKRKMMDGLVEMMTDAVFPKGGIGASGGGGLIGAISGGIKSLFGHAAGTDYSSGGLKIVGEKGPEIVGLPKGSQVLPNNLLRKGFGVPSGSHAGGVTVHAPTYIYADDAVVAGQLQDLIAQSSVQAVRTAITETQKVMGLNAQQQYGRR